MELLECIIVSVLLVRREKNCIRVNVLSELHYVLFHTANEKMKDAVHYYFLLFLLVHRPLSSKPLPQQRNV